MQAHSREVAINLLNTVDAINNLESLHSADTILFGSPTYFGSVSADFKKFMEATGSFWYKQLWKDKLAAGFTNSSTTNGDKLATINTIALFAAQHSMLWISQGIMPRFICNQQTDGQNRLGSYLGLMTQSDNDLKQVNQMHPGDQVTAELFAKRIVDITIQLRSNSLSNKKQFQKQITFKLNIMKKLLENKTDITSALLRLMLALIIFPHGAQKMLGWFGGYGFSGTMSYFTGTLSLPYSVAFLVVLIEFTSPFLLVIGGFTRQTAAAIFALFTGIILTSHLSNGFFMNWFGNQPGEGYEYHLLILTISLALMLLGSGKYAIPKPFGKFYPVKS